MPSDSNETPPTVGGRGLLPPASIITRLYKGQTLHVNVVPHSFEFAVHTYRSLSAVAKAVTGEQCSGIAFFRLEVVSNRRNCQPVARSDKMTK